MKLKRLSARKMKEITEWRTLSGDILQAACNVFANARAQAKENGFTGESCLGVTLLGRAISNFRGALLLLDHKRVIEARIITRCCLENFFWAAALFGEGEKFVRDAISDTVSHKLNASQGLFASRLLRGDEAEQRLRAWKKDQTKEFPNPKLLSVKEVAKKSSVNQAYILYEQLSSDAGHPSFDALNRHVISDSAGEICDYQDEPILSTEELAQTLQTLCMAVLGVCDHVSELIGETSGGGAIKGLLDRYVLLTKRSAKNA